MLVYHETFSGADLLDLDDLCILPAVENSPTFSELAKSPMKASTEVDLLHKEDVRPNPQALNHLKLLEE